MSSKGVYEQRLREWQAFEEELKHGIFTRAKPTGPGYDWICSCNSHLTCYHIEIQRLTKKDDPEMEPYTKVHLVFLIDQTHDRVLLEKRIITRYGYWQKNRFQRPRFKTWYEVQKFFGLRKKEGRNWARRFFLQIF